MQNNILNKETKKQEDSNKLLLPCGYCSYSQWKMWLTNPARYKKEYFEGGDKLNTKYLKFGKTAAELREKREVKQSEIPELEVKVNVREVPVLSYIDCYDNKEHIFYEDKTGKIAWTDSKVQKHEQLPFYATVLKWKYGTMPEKCILTWFETKDSEQSGLCNEIEFTGYEKEFTRYFDEREVERIETSIVKVANEISIAYKQYLNNLDL